MSPTQTPPPPTTTKTTSTSHPGVTSYASPPLPTPTHGPSGGTFSIFTTCHIAAPPSAVLQATLDTSTWSKWNVFVPHVTITSSPSAPTNTESSAQNSGKEEGHLDVGTKMIYHCRMKGTRSPKVTDSAEEVTIIRELAEGDAEGGKEKKGYLVCWKTKMVPEWLLRGERVNEIVDDGKGGTEYRSWVTFYGPLARVVELSVRGDLVERFGDWAGGLKGYFEEEGAIQDEGS